MRDFLRGCLIWFVGFPLSVVIATAVLTAPIWATSPSPFETGMRMVLGAAPVVGFFALLPALMTPPSTRLWPYTAAGARTGAWCGALAVSMYVIVVVVGAASEIFRAVTEGRVAAPEMLLTLVAWIAGAIAVFTVAGAAGGTVFGLAASGASE